MCDRDDFPLESALELTDLTGEVWQIQFSHDGSRLAAAGGAEAVIIWDTESFEVRHHLAGHEGGVGNISWSPDDSMMVTCGRDKVARIWDANVSRHRTPELVNNGADYLS
jgi:WD40 repeat protein